MSGAAVDSYVAAALVEADMLVTDADLPHTALVVPVADSADTALEHTALPDIVAVVAYSPRTVTPRMSVAAY